MFSHYVMTPFNVNVYKREALLNTPGHKHAGWRAEDWMEHRWNLFESFTLPSMQKQTNQNFTWILFLDKDTPAWLQSKLDAITVPQIKQVYFSDNEVEEWGTRMNLKRYLNPAYEYTITTRMDNDDAFNENFIQRIQNCFDSTAPKAVICPNGYIYGTVKDELYAMKYIGCNCPSLIEKTATARTCLCCGHVYVQRRGRGNVSFIDDPMWLMVVHGRNVKNKMVNGGSGAGKIVDQSKPLDKSVLASFNIRLERLCPN